ncbi:hypothetical protein ACFW04_014054 [Cataglyphis niger]
MCDILRKKPKRSFVDSWLNDARFKSWIRKVSFDDSLFNCIVYNKNFLCNSNILRHADSAFPNDVNSFFCSICDKSIVGGLSQIYRHAESKIHRNKSKKNTNTANENNKSNENLNTQDESLLSFDERKKYAKIRYAALITEKNVLESMSMDRTKCKNIISNVLYPVKTKYICNKKWMTFIIRYVDPETLDVRFQLVKLINIDARDSLAAHTAFAEMPALCEEFLRKITTYINTSPKHSAIFNEFRLFESWDTIKYFLNKIVDQPKSAKHLLSIMENVNIKAYFLFLKYVLNFLNQFNAFFQVIETRIHLLQPRFVNFLIKISQNFIKPDLLKHLLINLTFNDKENHKSLNDINLGPECEQFILEKLVKEGHADVTNIRQNCLQFYLIAAEEIKKRLSVNDAFLYKLKVFQPQASLFDDNRETSFNDVSFIAKTLGGFDENNLKTKKRNRFLSTCINATCVIKSALKAREKTTLQMKIDEQHLSLMSADKLYKNFEEKKKNNLTFNAADIDDDC